MAAGVVIGESIMGWIHAETHEIEMVAEVGVFLLLFSIGLQLTIEELGEMGKHLVVGGGLQMLLVAVPVLMVFISLGVAPQAAILVAAAAAFSSTVIVFRTLSELGQDASAHGRRAIAILLFQDAALVPLILAIPLLTGQGEGAGVQAYFELAAVSVFFIGAVIAARLLLARHVVPLMAQYRSPELVLILALVVLGGITYSAYQLGLPAAVGAFAAGLVFSDNRWTPQIDALVLPFREAFSLVFFVSLGLLVDAALFVVQPGLMVASAAGLIVIKALAAMLALRLTGLRWRASLATGLGLAHVGEFAFVLVAIGWKAGVLDEVFYGQFISVSLATLIFSPLLLQGALRKLSAAAEPHPARHSRKERRITPRRSAVVIGVGPIGKAVASRLETIGCEVRLVDRSAVNLHGFAQQGFRTVAGDAGDERVLRTIEADTAELVVISVPDDLVAVRIVRQVRQLNPKCYIVVRCRYQMNAARLQRAGANHVVSEETEAMGALMNVLDESQR